MPLNLKPHVVNHLWRLLRNLELDLEARGLWKFKHTSQPKPGEFYQRKSRYLETHRYLMFRTDALQVHNGQVCLHQQDQDVRLHVPPLTQTTYRVAHLYRWVE